MDRVIPIRTEIRTSTVVIFVAIGLLLYVLLFAAAEWLVYRTGHMNPIFKIETAEHRDYDWIILGASHAMPLDFGGMNEEIEKRIGVRILNLAGPGTGPLYSRFVLEHFLAEHSTRGVLYVADGFAFRSPIWNEERFLDAKLLSRTPFGLSVLSRLASYVVRAGVDPRALLDYATGFSKMNNRDRFKTDVWEVENTFDRTFKPSATADRKRIDYLYPPVEDEGAARSRYLSVLSELIATAQDHGARVAIVRPPVPANFRRLLPGEDDFAAALQSLAEKQGAEIFDYSASMDDPRFYGDTDHLNRAGVTELVERHLGAVLAGQGARTGEDDRDAAAGGQVWD